MEIGGLTVGAIALAGLFNNCVEAFSYLKAGQSLEHDLEILLVKLDIEKARLLSWGNSVGIVRPINDGRSNVLEEYSNTEIISVALRNIHLLLTDSQRLRDRYAMRAIMESSNTTEPRRLDLVSHTSMNIFRRSYIRLCNRIVENRSQVPVANRIIWAVHDRGKFNDLIQDLRELIDGLVILLTPIVQSAANRIVEDDIATLGLPSLRLVEEACQDQERYRAWSDVASEAIHASEHSTTDHRDIEEWVADHSTEAVTASESNSSAVPVQMESRAPHLASETKVFFMFTGQCMSAARAEKPCIDPRFHQNTSYFTHSSMLTTVHPQWHPGRRITSFINLSDFTKLETEQLRIGLQRRYQHAIESDNTLEDIFIMNSNDLRHIATIFIYCPPCTYLIDTAVSVCVHMADPQLLQRLIRVDDRLPCSCFDSSLASKNLKMIIGHIMEVEQRSSGRPSRLHQSRAEYIDRDFIESRIWILEEEEVQPSTATAEENIRRIFDDHCYDDKVAGVVFLGELQALAPMLQLPLFSQVSRMPRENEMYVSSLGNGVSGPPWERRLMGTFSTRALS